mmetsp:Transcript_9442/g.17498  ORF Transcript_9442/g.17498 Transcript_9442/m.17498 type:complete len:124 (-) Transcript_9442:120-491(-)
MGCGASLPPQAPNFDNLAKVVPGCSPDQACKDPDKPCPRSRGLLCEARTGIETEEWDDVAAAQKSIKSWVSSTWIPSSARHPQSPNRADHEAHVRRVTNFLQQVDIEPGTLKKSVRRRRRAFL